MAHIQDWNAELDFAPIDSNVLPRHSDAKAALPDWILTSHPAVSSWFGSNAISEYIQPSIPRQFHELLCSYLR